MNSLDLEGHIKNELGFYGRAPLTFVLRLSTLHLLRRRLEDRAAR